MSALGGVPVAAGAAAMRAARLARFADQGAPEMTAATEPNTNDSASAPLHVTSFMRACGHLPDPYSEPEAYAMLHATVHQNNLNSNELCATASGQNIQIMEVSQDRPTSPKEALLSISGQVDPVFLEGALLNITAHLDLGSGRAFICVNRSIHEMTQVALCTLSTGIAKAKEEAIAVTAAIEQERLEGRRLHAAQGRVAADALELLTPLRNSTLAQRHGPQIEEILTELEQHVQPTERILEAEAVLEAREAEAQASAKNAEEVLRALVAQGYAHQGAQKVFAAIDITVGQPADFNGSEQFHATTALKSSADQSENHSVADEMQLDVTPNFESLPDEVFSRLAAHTDLESCVALGTVDNATCVRMSTALQALREGIAQIHDAQVVTTATIEDERSAERQQHAAGSVAYAQALGILAPLRTGRAQDRYGTQIAELFDLLQQGSQQQLPTEVEAAFDARIAEVATLAMTREAEVRSRVADGEMQFAIAYES